MHREFWNSQAALVRPDGDRAEKFAVGRLYEMVDHLLSQPVELRHELLLDGDALDRPLDAVEATKLRRREDFPLVC